MTGYGLDGSLIESPMTARNFLHTRPDWPWGSPNFLNNECQSSVLAVKRTWCDVSHPHPFSAEVKNEWSYISTPPLCVVHYEEGRTN